MSHLDDYLIAFEGAYPVEFSLKDILQDIVEHNHEELAVDARTKLLELELLGKN